MRKISLPLIIAVALAAAAADRTPPPPGFSWQELPEIRGAVLKPTGWFFKQEVQKGTLAYFVSKEDIEKTGEFKTGLTLNVFRTERHSAVARARQTIEQLLQRNPGGSRWEKHSGAFNIFGCKVRDADESGVIVMHTVAVANEKTDTLYLLIFESPESEWENSWKNGKDMIDQVMFDERF